MPINPIDLQANFTQINHVGRQQSNVKDLEQVKELQLNLQVQKEGEDNSDNVPITKSLSDGAGKIKDEERKKRDHKKKDKDASEELTENIDEDIQNDNNITTKDKNIGTKIDIIG